MASNICNLCQACKDCSLIDIARLNVNQAKNYVHVHNTCKDSSEVHKNYEIAMEIINLWVKFEMKFKQMGIEI
jgi:hypothetical protein